MKKLVTFTFVKPHAFKHRRQIMLMILQAGYQVVASKEYLFTREEAEKFYGIHKDKPFFEEIVNALLEGPVMMMLLSREDVENHSCLIGNYRGFIGKTNPAEAEPGTIRYAFGEHKVGPNNAVHGSDSPENAIIESGQFSEVDELGIAA